MGTSSTQKTSNEPPKWAAPLFTKSAEEATKMYDNETGFNSWQGPTVAAPSKWTEQGMYGLADEAGRGAGMETNVRDQANRVLGSGGLSGGARGAINDLYRMGESGGIPHTAEKYYTDMAEGKMLNGNPFFDAALQSQTDKTADQVNLSMAGAGRYGSGAHTGTLTDAIGDIRTKALSENFGRERGYQMEAIRGLTDADQRRFGNKLSSIQTGAGVESQGAGDALGYINALPTIQENRTFDENLLMQAGGMRDQQRQAELNDQIRKFTEKDMEEITRLGFLQSAATGSAGPYGTSKTVSQQPWNPMSLFSMLGLFG